MAKKTTESTEIKAATIFDHLNNVYIAKPEWNSISDLDKSSWNTYMINRWVSMKFDYLPVINDVQKYTIGNLDNREAYNIYRGFFPKAKVYAKYIKAIDSEKYNPDLVDLISLYYSCGTTDALVYLDIFFKDDDNLEELVSIISKYGKTDSEIKKLITKK